MVGNPIWVLLEIYCCLQQWKNFANRSRIDKVIAMVMVAPFFWLTVFDSLMTCDHCNHSHMLRILYRLDTGTGEVPVAKMTLKGHSKSLAMSDRHRTYDFLLLIHSSDFFLRHINQWSVILHHHAKSITCTHEGCQAIIKFLNCVSHI